MLSESFSEVRKELFVLSRVYDRRARSPCSTTCTTKSIDTLMHTGGEPDEMISQETEKTIM